MAATATTTEDLVAVIRDRGAHGRSLTAIAGPPGAGKSTLAEALVEALNAEAAESAAVLPMDGYHFDDLVLVPRGWRARKGAPHTFDVAGLAHMLGRLHANTEAEIAVPVFDRSLEIARAGARIIPAGVRHLIVEGNYLLLETDPWAGLQRYFETTVLATAPMPVIEARLAERWADLPAAEARAKLEENDLLNARLILAKSRTPEFLLETGPA